MAAFSFLQHALVSKLPPSDRRDDVPSPCIQVCALDVHGICTGCQRSIDEITRWGAATAAQRLAILDRVAHRRARMAPGIARAQGAGR